MTGTSPSFLLHPLDLIGGDKLTALSFFPGMDLSSEKKARVFRQVIGTLSKHFDLVNMSTHAKYLLKDKNLQTFSAI
jgi:peptidoglycan-N-acetylglucosamine deacetylase